MNAKRSLVALGILVVLASGCETAPEPVGSVRIEPAEIPLPYPGFARVEMTWDLATALDGVEGGPLVFVHLLNAEGDVERTFDHALPFDWQPDTSQSYELTLFQSALAPPLEAGDYRLSVGLYDAADQRWALSGVGEEVAQLEYHLATVNTEGDPTAVPMFYFSPSWLPLEAGTDVQILGRRWLTDEGTIRVAEIPGTGTVWMQLQLSEPLAQIEEISFLEGEDEPQVVLASTCGGEEAVISDFGLHGMEVRVTTTDEGELPEECEIVLRPNFQIVEVDTLTRRSVGLQILTWSAD
jgi:hypothetical protein